MITTKRAYEELEKAGLIYTVPGRGSFIAEHTRGELAKSKRQLVEEKLKEAVAVAERMGLEKQEVKNMLARLLGGE